MKILVAEDDPTSLILIQRLLEPYGEVHTTTNGRDAIAAFRTAVMESKPYDLVCLDVVMPGIGGHTVLWVIRHIEDERTRAKIIMTTSLADFASIEKAVKRHCDAYIVKPVTKRLLIDKLRSLDLI